MLSHNFTQRVTDTNHIYAVYYRAASRRPLTSSAATDSQIRITNEGPQARNITPRNHRIILRRGEVRKSHRSKCDDRYNAISNQTLHFQSFQGNVPSSSA